MLPPLFTCSPPRLGANVMSISVRKGTAMQIKKLAVAAVASGALALSLVSAAPASADYAPSTADVVGVGSDTVQYAIDFMADGDGRLFGVAEPGGRLPITVPRRLEDTPAFPYYPGVNDHMPYGEGLLIGHRWYDHEGIEPAFPFGHGLGGLQLALAVQLHAAFGRREQLPGCSTGVVHADGGAELHHIGVALGAAGAQVQHLLATNEGGDGTGRAGDGGEAEKAGEGSTSDAVSVGPPRPACSSEREVRNPHRRPVTPAKVAMCREGSRRPFQNPAGTGSSSLTSMRSRYRNGSAATMGRWDYPRSTAEWTARSRVGTNRSACAATES